MPELQFIAGDAAPKVMIHDDGLAIVALKPARTTTEAEIIAYCRDNLARFKCPRDIAFVAALPRNATREVHKPTLRAQCMPPPSAT